MTKNITLSVDEDVLAKVRRIAAEKDTTVNAMVREYLTRIADFEDRAARAREELLRLAERSTAEVGPITWTRDEVHER